MNVWSDFRALHPRPFRSRWGMRCVQRCRPRQSRNFDWRRCQSRSRKKVSARHSRSRRALSGDLWGSRRRFLQRRKKGVFCKVGLMGKHLKVRRLWKILLLCLCLSWPLFLKVLGDFCSSLGVWIGLCCWLRAESYFFLSLSWLIDSCEWFCGGGLDLIVSLDSNDL